MVGIGPFIPQKDTPFGEKKAGTMDEKILILSEFFPCQKQLSATEIAFLIFPSNRGGYCVQPVRKENSFNYKYDFPETWLGLEKEALQEATGLSDVSFCHKGGFLLTAETLDDAVAACRISLAGMPNVPESEGKVCVWAIIPIPPQF